MAIPMATQVQFWLFGLLAVVSALLFVTRKSPVAAALWLVNTMFCLSGLYVMLDAPFVGAVQVLVYAGAIMVVFLFVVMLLNLGADDLKVDLRSPGVRAGAVIVGILMAAEIFIATRVALPPLPALRPNGGNAVTEVASSLFRDHLVAFEITSVLLLVAIIGAVTLAKREGSA